MKTKFNDFINEKFNHYNLIDDIKKMLILENMIDEDDFNEQYNGDWNKAWKDFVDNQEMGDCQSIVSSIIYSFPQVKKVFGEIERDESYIDEYGGPQVLSTHHWVEINGDIYDFSKGTLSDYIDWFDLYDVGVDGDEWRYQ